MPDGVGEACDRVETSRIGPLELARLDRAKLLDLVFQHLGQGRGGWLLTPNLHFCALATRDPEVQALFSKADLAVADGAPLLWASWLLGRPVPERVPGADLIWDIAERAAREERSVYFLGGAPGVARRTAEVLSRQWPALSVSGWSDPTVSERPPAGELDAIIAELEKKQPDFVFVALGAPKQERVCGALRRALPRTWMMGVGGGFDFVAGRRRRAPRWLQAVGFEWVYRFCQEPRRLGRRYFFEDMPCAIQLALGALLSRSSRIQ